MKSLKKAMVLVFALSLPWAAYAGTPTTEDMMKQFRSNTAIGFINGYWIKPVALSDNRIGMAFIPHENAIQMGLRDVVAMTEAHKGLDTMAEILSLERLDLHSHLGIGSVVIVEITDMLFDFGIDMGGWWGGYLDNSGMNDPPYGWGDDSVDDFQADDQNWWDEDEDDPKYGPDEYDTSINGSGGDDSGEDPPHGWSDDPEPGDNIVGGNCPPPTLCFQTTAIGLLGMETEAVRDTAREAFFRITTQAQNAYNLPAMTKGADAMSVILNPSQLKR